jgi:hypothetical protein
MERTLGDAPPRAASMRTLARDQFPESAMNELCFLLDSRELAGLLDQAIIQIKRRPHIAQTRAGDDY